MTSNGEPRQLRRGKRFHKRIQEAWQDPNDKTFRVEKRVDIEFPPELAALKRTGRIDVYFGLSDASGAAIFEIKATDWDKVKYRRKLLGSHRRQLLKYVDQFLLLKDISVCATVVYPTRPTGHGVCQEVEDYMGEWAIQVMWYENG